jgi:hypothetical protein
MALAGVDTGALASYSESMAADPTLIALRDKVRFEFQEGRPNTIAEVEILLTDGRRFTACHDAGIPANDIDEQGRRLEQKFMSLAAPVLGGAKAGELVGLVRTAVSADDLQKALRLCATRR